MHKQLTESWHEFQNLRAIGFGRMSFSSLLLAWHGKCSSCLAPSDIVTICPNVEGRTFPSVPATIIPYLFEAKQPFSLCHRNIFNTQVYPHKHKLGMVVDRGMDLCCDCRTPCSQSVLVTAKELSSPSPS
jgi:hypothetical protein